MREEILDLVKSILNPRLMKKIKNKIQEVLQPIEAEV